ncbi:hypothetical protein, partial [Rhizobium ruizarguesonis]|uniref:hypothetical protein n=1 Tax=Rhizobium ruizarguesonis TaxID=2081791 RepID=UPI001A900595
IIECGVTQHIILIAAAQQGQKFRRDFDFVVRKTVKSAPPICGGEVGMSVCVQSRSVTLGASSAI